MTVDITTEPSTLPLREATVRVDLQLGSGAEAESQVEERHTVFDWAGTSC